MCVVGFGGFFFLLGLFGGFVLFSVFVCFVERLYFFKHDAE